jgi:uncharacterized repeat protein (TIGR01451 family)
MTAALRSLPRALAFKLALVAGVLLLALVLANPAQAQLTGASASKDCGDPGETVTPGDTITCEFTVENIGALPATVTTLREISPFPGGTPVNVSCTAAGTPITVGSTLVNDVPCTGTFEVTIPQDPTLCGTFLADRVEIALRYTDVLVADAGATGITFIECPAEITITKTADALSKVGDSVTYTFEICNVGEGVVTRDSVVDTLLGDIAGSFPATLAPGACATVELERTVQAGDPDPLTNTVTAIYSTGASSDTATANASTNLFQPSVDVTKSCEPDPVEVGEVVTCTIVVTNTSSDDAPNLVNGTIVDTLTGNLLDPANTAVTSSDCTAVLPNPAGPGGTCTIVTERTVLASDPSELCNTVTVNYNPMGFPNNITDSATACVEVKPPRGGEGCTPGFWKQDQHFDSWVGFAPEDSFEDVFGVDVTLRAGGQNTIDDPTLLDALNATGGGVNALARHAVAALLNASNPDVSFDLTPQEVIDLVQAAIESGDPAQIQAAHEQLAELNEQGCPLN